MNDIFGETPPAEVQQELAAMFGQQPAGAGTADAKTAEVITRAVSLVGEYRRWADAPPGAHIDPVTGPEIRIDAWEWMPWAAAALSDLLALVGEEKPAGASVLTSQSTKVGRHWAPVWPGVEARLGSFASVNEAAYAWIDTRPEVRRG